MNSSLVSRARLVIGAWLFMGILALFAFFPWHPSTRTGWAIFLLLAPALLVAGDWLSERFARPWWETSVAGKAAKAMMLILVALLVLGMMAVLRG